MERFFFAFRKKNYENCENQNESHLWWIKLYIGELFYFRSICGNSNPLQSNQKFFWEMNFWRTWGLSRDQFESFDHGPQLSLYNPSFTFLCHYILVISSHFRSFEVRVWKTNRWLDFFIKLAIGFSYTENYKMFLNEFLFVFAQIEFFNDTIWSGQFMVIFRRHVTHRSDWWLDSIGQVEGR